jgi:hypothetical protein
MTLYIRDAFPNAGAFGSVSPEVVDHSGLPFH